MSLKLSVTITGTDDKFLAEINHGHVVLAKAMGLSPQDAVETAANEVRAALQKAVEWFDPPELDALEEPPSTKPIDERGSVPVYRTDK